LDVKRLIWEHEQDELIGKKSEGKDDHITLAVKEGAVLGLGAEAFEDTPMLEGAITCFYSWLHLSQRPWLEAIASSAILEIRNSAELIKGGSLSRRIGEKFERELGIPMKKQCRARRDGRRARASLDADRAEICDHGSRPERNHQGR
jgi:hypothetical protein